MLPVDDTELYVQVTGGPGVYLNGAYADQWHWKRVIADPGPGYRHITNDERAQLAAEHGPSRCCGRS